MDKETASRFFNNVTWFNKFFSDLNILYDKLKVSIEKTFQIEGGYYYYKSNICPSIPVLYFLYFGGDKKIGVQIATVLDKSYIKNRDISMEEPSLIVVIHDYENYGNTGVTEHILAGNNIKKLEIKGDLIRGKLSWEVEISFYAFIIPIDKFSDFKDELIESEIIEKIRDVCKDIRSPL